MADTPQSQEQEIQFGEQDPRYNSKITRELNREMQIVLREVLPDSERPEDYLLQTDKKLFGYIQSLLKGLFQRILDRLPSINQKAALSGTAGSPSDANRYVTNSDPRVPGLPNIAGLFLNGTGHYSRPSSSGVGQDPDHNFITDAELEVLQNTSGVNTGDQDLSGLVPKTTRVNNRPLTGDIVITPDDVGSDEAGTQRVEVTANQDILPGDVVSTTGRVCDSSDPSSFRGRVLGVADVTILNSFVGKVVSSGIATNPDWAWTGNADIFLNGTSLSETPPSSGFLVRIGTATGPTTVLVNVGIQILL